MKDAFFTYLNKTIGEYVYGFSQEQLTVGIMTGKLELRNLNLKPASINKLLITNDFGIRSHNNFPVSLKVGLISRVFIDYGSILSVSEKVRVQIDDVTLILQPSASTLRTSLDYFEQDDRFQLLANRLSEKAITEPLAVSSRIFQTFANEKLVKSIEAQLKNTSSYQDDNSQKTTNKKRNNQEMQQQPSGQSDLFSQQIDEKIKEIYSKMQVSIKRIHLRFEDQIIEPSNPLSIGLLISNLNFTQDQTTSSASNISSWFSETFPNNSASHLSPNAKENQNGSDPKESTGWKIELEDVKLYLKLQSEELITESLLRETAFSRNGILEILRFSDIQDYFCGSQFFGGSSNLDTFFIEILRLQKLSMHVNKNHLPLSNQILVHIEKPIIGCSASVVKSFSKVIAFFDAAYFNVNTLNAFKPHLRPKQEKFSGKLNPNQQRLNKLIVAEWFRVLIWKQRLLKKRLPAREVYRHYQLTSSLYSLEHPEILSVQKSIRESKKLAELLTEFEMQDKQEMNPVSKSRNKEENQNNKSTQFIFKINKIDFCFYSEKQTASSTTSGGATSVSNQVAIQQNRFLSLQLPLIQLNLASNLQEQITHLSCEILESKVYLYGGVFKQLQANTKKQGGFTAQQQQSQPDKRQQGSVRQSYETSVIVPDIDGPFMPRSIYDTNNKFSPSSTVSSLTSPRGQNLGQGTRRIFGSHNNDTQNNLTHNINNNPSSVNNLNDNNNNNGGYSANQSRVEAFENMPKVSYAAPATSNGIVSDNISENTARKKKSIFSQDFGVQRDFFNLNTTMNQQQSVYGQGNNNINNTNIYFNHSVKSSSSAKTITDLNSLGSERRQLREILSTKAPLTFLFTSETAAEPLNNSENEDINNNNRISSEQKEITRIQVNISIPESSVTFDTRDLKEITEYFRPYEIDVYFKKQWNRHANNTGLPQPSIVRLARATKYQLSENLKKSQLQISKEHQIRNGLVLFDDDDDDENEDASQQGHNNKTDRIEDLLAGMPSDEDVPDDFKTNEMPPVPAGKQTYNNPFIHQRLESIQEDPQETIGASTIKLPQSVILYQQSSQQQEQQLAMTNLASSIQKKMMKLQIQTPIIPRVQDMDNFYLFHKILEIVRNRRRLAEPVEFIDRIAQLIRGKQINCCVNVGMISVAVKDYFQSADATIAALTVPSGQIIASTCSPLHQNRHVLDVYRFQLETTSELQAIKFLVARVNKILDLSELFQK